MWGLTRSICGGMRPATVALHRHAGKHRVAYDGQQGGGDAWLALAGARFQWLGGPRAGQGPNPTFAALPAKEELVGARVKVFWPGMGR